MQTLTEKQQQLFDWTIARINPRGYGSKYNGGVRWLNKKAKVAAAIAGQRVPIAQIREAQFTKHWDSDETYYYSGPSYESQECCLLGIDIDCHEFGTLEAAIQLVEHLKAKYGWDSLYHEPSTNGNGVHAYIVVRRRDMAGFRCPNEVINALYKRIQHWLDKERVDAGFGDSVQLVEVKGRCQVVKNGTLLRLGTLMKLPRDASRADEIMATTEVSAGELLAMFPDVPAEKKKRQPKRQRPTAPAATGSFAAWPDCQPYLDAIPSLEAALTQGMKSFSTKNKHLVSPYILAVMAAQLLLFRDGWKNGDATAKNRFKVLHQYWYRECGVARSFDTSRFKAARDLLDRMGMIEWESNEYTVRAPGESGIAMRYKASVKLGALRDQLKKKNENARNYGCSLASDFFELSKQAVTSVRNLSSDFVAWLRAKKAGLCDRPPDWIEELYGACAA